MRTPKWKLVEAVVAAIEGAEPGVSVTGNAMVRSRTDPAERRQVDVYVVTTLGRRRIRMGVEVKDESAPLDVTKVEQVAVKLADVAVDLRWLISTSGYTSGAESRARRMGLRLSTMEQVQSGAWRRSFTAYRHSAEPVHVNINYDGGPSARLKERMSASGPEKIRLLDRKGVAVPVLEFVTAYGVESLRQIEAPLTDQQLFAVRLETPGEHWDALLIDDEKFEAPAHLLVIYRLHEQVDVVDMRRYQLEGRDISITTSPIDVLGRSRFLGFLTQPNEDGTLQLKLTLTVPNPPPVPVGEDGAP